ncbi:MAG: YicC/YloC family endoribonuclease [Dialister pneumosintes]
MRSMTGYGNGTASNDMGMIEVSIKTVNCRFLEITVHDSKLPVSVSQEIYTTIKESLERGKVIAKITFTPSTALKQKQITVDTDLLNSYMDAFSKLKDIKGLKTKKIRIQDLLDLPVSWLHVDEPKIEESELILLTKEATKVALDQVMDMREQEGQNLAQDILRRIDWIEKQRIFLVENAEQSSYAYEKRFRERLLNLIAETGLLLDKGRILTEIAAHAEKTDFTEEVIRLGSHLEQFKQILLQEKVVGKKLNFLLQEINREVNTTASKSDLIEVLNCVIMIKTELEKIREQVQNLE